VKSELPLTRLLPEMIFDMLDDVANVPRPPFDLPELPDVELGGGVGCRKQGVLRVSNIMIFWETVFGLAACCGASFPCVALVPIFSELVRVPLPVALVGSSSVGTNEPSGFVRKDCLCA